jgi:fructose-1,6-bisphosphatase/inositol monophosphatase family enzyme
VPDPLIHPVGRLLRHAARTAVLPLYRRLALDDVEEKAPGELVTVADREAERIIGAGLRELLPGSAVVGEEGVAADPALLDRLGDAGPVWLVDPVDGTANFAAGRGPFVIMVALLRDGVTRAGWILDPRSGSLATARRGRGAYLDGRRVTALGGSAREGRGRAGGRAAEPAVRSGNGLRGVVTSRYLPASLRDDVRRRAHTLGDVLPGHGCAGREYPDIVGGAQDFALFWRTLPWDHAAGSLFTEEAGGVVRRLDGSAYDPTDRPRVGLLAAASEPVWRRVRDTLFPDGPPADDGPAAA